MWQAPYWSFCLSPCIQYLTCVVLSLELRVYELPCLLPHHRIVPECYCRTSRSFRAIGTPECMCLCEGRHFCSHTGTLDTSIRLCSHNFHHHNQVIAEQRARRCHLQSPWSWPSSRLLRLCWKPSIHHTALDRMVLKQSRLYTNLSKARRDLHTHNRCLLQWK